MVALSHPEATKTSPLWRYFLKGLKIATITKRSKQATRCHPTDLYEGHIRQSKRPKQRREQQVCSYPGCKTKLSVYEPWRDLCSAHLHYGERNES